MMFKSNIFLLKIKYRLNFIFNNFLLVIALGQTNAFSVYDVDCRYDFHLPWLKGQRYLTGYFILP